MLLGLLADCPQLFYNEKKVIGTKILGMNCVYQMNYIIFLSKDTKMMYLQHAQMLSVETI